MTLRQAQHTKNNFTKLSLSPHNCWPKFTFKTKKTYNFPKWHLLLQKAKTNSNSLETLPITHKPHTPCFRLVQTRNSLKMLTLFQLSSQKALNFKPFIFLDNFHLPHNLTKYPKQTHIIFPFHNFFMLTPWPKSQPKRYFLLKSPNCHELFKIPTSNFPILILSSYRPQKPLLHFIYDLTKMSQYPLAFKNLKNSKWPIETSFFKSPSKPFDRSHTIHFLAKVTTQNLHKITFQNFFMLSPKSKS